MRAAFKTLRNGTVIMSTADAQTEVLPVPGRDSREKLDDLRRRIAATRWPSKELVDDRSQGVQLATMQELAATGRPTTTGARLEARLNALPQFTTEIDGVDIHFIHVRSPARGRVAADHDPRLARLGRSSCSRPRAADRPDRPRRQRRGRVPPRAAVASRATASRASRRELGWYAGRVAQAWAQLMQRLGYTRYVAQGGDVGAAITDAMGRLAPEGLVGIHINLLVTALGGGPQPTDTDEEKAALEALAEFRATGFGYFLEQATRPQTIGYALLDSPVALAAWMLDHDTDSYYKISGAFVDGKPTGGLTRDHILDNITLYWLTGTGASAARSYWESGRAQAQRPRPARRRRRHGPGRLHAVPGRDLPGAAQLGRAGYPNLIYFHKADKGGHFAAWEEPRDLRRRDQGGVRARGAGRR